MKLGHNPGAWTSLWEWCWTRYWCNYVMLRGEGLPRETVEGSALHLHDLGSHSSIFLPESQRSRCRAEPLELIKPVCSPAGGLLNSYGQAAFCLVHLMMNLSIRYIYYLLCKGCWGQSQLALGKRRGTPSTTLDPCPRTPHRKTPGRVSNQEPSCWLKRVKPLDLTKPESHLLVYYIYIQVQVADNYIQ